VTAVPPEQNYSEILRVSGRVTVMKHAMKFGLPAETVTEIKGTNAASALHFEAKVFKLK
jgi:hypothetical protein